MISPPNSRWMRPTPVSSGDAESDDMSSSSGSKSESLAGPESRAQLGVFAWPGEASSSVGASGQGPPSVPGPPVAPGPGSGDTGAAGAGAGDTGGAAGAGT